LLNLQHDVQTLFRSPTVSRPARAFRYPMRPRI
jgi:hypothetical protein